MIEIAISGRGGQGVVLASQIIASAFFKNGMAVQAFPSFGAERRGAPVSAYVRADHEEITQRCGVYHADWLLFLDPQLLVSGHLIQTLKKDGSILINGGRLPEGFSDKGHPIFLVDAASIALRLGLGSPEFPIINTAMTGAFARASALLDLSSVMDAVREMSPVEQERNAKAAEEAFGIVRREETP